MNILVTGANGQLGQCLRDLAENDSENTWFWTDVSEIEGRKCDYLDIVDEEEVKKFVKNNHINVIINCAAYTNVDKAENDYEMAEALNGIAPRNLAEAALSVGAKLIHISTDYVFMGTSYFPYTEDRLTLPVTVYGKTKVMGEEYIKESGCNYFIFRTAWLYSEYGNNFVKTMMKLIREVRRDSINVVNDQIGTPTYARDLADLIFGVVTQHSLKTGIYNFTNEGVCSWYDFARKIRDVLKTGYLAEVCGVTTKEYYGDKPHAKRPFYSVLSKEKVKKDFPDFFYARSWMDAVEVCVERLKHTEEKNKI